jgi:Polysaccharide biosynthesis protein
VAHGSDHTSELSAAGKGEYDAYEGRVARGAGISSAGQGVGRVLGYATQVALARFFGSARLGFYVVGVAVVQPANVLSRFGMDNGVVRYVAHYRAEDDHARVRGTVLLVLGVAFALSVALSVLLFAGAGLVAEGVLRKPFMENTFRTFSPAVPFFALMGAALFATQGFQTVRYAAYVGHVLRPLIDLYRSKGFCHKQLSRYLELFGREPLRVYLYEDLKDGPVEAAQDIFRFPAVDDSFVPDASLSYNAAGVPKNRLLYATVKRTGPVKLFLRHRLPFGVSRRLKDFSFAEPPLPKAREGLIRAYRDDVPRLQDSTGRDLSGCLEEGA